MESPAFVSSLTERSTGGARLSLSRIFWNVFRAVELCVALFIVIWISARLPLAVRFSFGCLRTALSFAARPLVVFVVSNVIIGTVLAKSCRFSGQSSGQNDAVDDYYDEIGELNENWQKLGITLGNEAGQEVVYHDKEVITSEIGVLVQSEEIHDGSSIVSDYSYDSDSEPDHQKAYLRRTWSEKLPDIRKQPEEEEVEEEIKVLRRSETEKYQKKTIDGDNLREVIDLAEELSSEEFQRTVEAFIAKELRFRREESMAIVLQSH
ncbi:hypothetical protein SAY86_016895 [Trapa natans]|uniref:DUF4408 domain-containing protein n=1 Tax=Trapa natans TaxID=22666 RepID=A0AAN7M4C9_TRANT|nr:hypothetical protein SAY86_016895 [Trapa natans]